MLSAKVILYTHKTLSSGMLSGKPLTYIEFKRSLKGDTSINQNFFDFADELINEMKQAGKIGNMLVYRNVTNCLKKFATRALDFSDIDVTFLHKWEVWLIGENGDRKGIAQSTANQYMRTISSVFNKAISRDVIAHELYPYRNQFNPKGYSYAHLKSEPKHRSLSEQELISFKSFNVVKYTDLADAHNFFMFKYYCYSTFH